VEIGRPYTNGGKLELLLVLAVHLRARRNPLRFGFDSIIKTSFNSSRANFTGVFWSVSPQVAILLVGYRPAAYCS